ncbi:hypothetical protein [Streptomyces sp. CC224B]|uniref:hypothetical protein n=1 Tax=Streptomyces sp. CC224B TaxID=3044571 RepID=UPI0024A87C8C|nr:hypothetical protein [Streptomyces sp. CC224B]
MITGALTVTTAKDLRPGDVLIGALGAQPLQEPREVTGAPAASADAPGTVSIPTREGGDPLMARAAKKMVVVRPR